MGVPPRIGMFKLGEEIATGEIGTGQQVARGIYRRRRHARRLQSRRKFLLVELL